MQRYPCRLGSRLYDMSSRKVLLLKCKVYLSMGNLILGLNSRYEWILVMVEAESGVCFCGHLGAMSFPRNFGFQG